MQGKWLEDFLLLAQERSFTRAAELRHVTHPAFGRRIRALEAWAGTPLVEPGGGPVRLTPAGEAFRDTAEQLVRTLAQSHDELQAVAGRQARVITLATGRTLARTIVADWLTRHGSVLQTAELRVSRARWTRPWPCCSAAKSASRWSTTTPPLACAWTAASSAT